MGFGVRGGLGPFRAGIGTNGVSGGVGPFSAWTGWGGGGKKPRRNDDDDQVVGWLIVGAIVLVLLALPYFGAAWVAERFGADNPSTVRSVVAWTVEGIWLALIAVLAIASLIPDKPAADVPDQQREAEAQNSEQETLPPPAQLARPERDFPAAVTFGHKVEPVLRKAWGGLSAYLDDDEDVVFAARVNKIKPAIELMVITDRRTLACSQNLKPGGRVPFDIPNDTIERFELSKRMDTVTVVLTDGSEVALGMLVSKKDLDLMPGSAGE